MIVQAKVRHIAKGYRRKNINPHATEYKLRVPFERVQEIFKGKTVAIVGSGPSVLDNSPGHIDRHDIVVRINNYKLMGENTGLRTDVYYSFFGNSIKKTPYELRKDGTKFVMCKCPNAGIESQWHTERGKTHGINWEWIYVKRKTYWFCETYVPSLERFNQYRELLDGHIPTTGLSAILDIVNTDYKTLYITGFDFFSSRVHNVNEKWVEGSKDDPIRHRPDLEKKLLQKIWNPNKMSGDKVLTGLIYG